MNIWHSKYELKEESRDQQKQKQNQNLLKGVNFEITDIEVKENRRVLFCSFKLYEITVFSRIQPLVESHHSTMNLCKKKIRDKKKPYG